MISSTDLKNGVTFISNGKPCKVVKYNHVKIGRGGAIVRVLAKDLITGTQDEKTYSANVKVEEAVLNKRKLQFLYSDGTTASFMDPKSFEQVEIPEKTIEDELPFFKEGEDVDVLFWDEKAISADIAPKVTLEVKDTPPGIKGNSASNVYKDAVLENEMHVRVPLFIQNGDRIRVDTRTNEYVERAKA